MLNNFIVFEETTASLIQQYLEQIPNKRLMSEAIVQLKKVEASAGFWSQLCWHTAVSWEVEPAEILQLNTAIQFLMAAAEMLDDVIDKEVESGAVAVHINTAGSFLSLAYLVVAEQPKLTAAFAVLSRGVLKAFAGQQLEFDIVEENLIQTEQKLEEIYFEQARLKTGEPIVAVISAVAALSKFFEVDRDIPILQDFGINWGLSHQIKNDLLALTQPHSNKTDLLQRKISFPLIYLRHKIEPELYTALLNRVAEDATPLMQALEETSAIVYANMLADIYEKQALSALEKSVRGKLLAAKLMSDIES